MLRKRARSTQKGQQQMGQIASDGGSETCLQSHLLSQRQKTNSFFDIPGLFVGLSPQSVSDCDSTTSPTSPLDLKLFSNLGNSIRFPKPCQDGQQKCWDCGKVGLCSIMDSLDKGDRNLPGKTIPSCNSKNILFGLQVRSKTPIISEEPKSLPKNYAIFPHAKMRPSNLQKGNSDVLFEIGGNPLGSDPFGKIQSFSLDSKRLGSGIHRLKTRHVATDININVRTNKPCLQIETGNVNPASFSADNRLTPGPMPINYSEEFARPLTPREIELSEDYTRVISHGPNPKTTHIFGDCVLDCHPAEVNFENKNESSENEKLVIEMPLPPSPYPSNDFLSCCYFCKKKLEDGKDIYMYRGEKAFCSWDCRLEEISMEEEKEKWMRKDGTAFVEPEIGDDIFEKNIFTFT